jgi:hypothetical protein
MNVSAGAVKKHEIEGMYAFVHSLTGLCSDLRQRCSPLISLIDWPSAIGVMSNQVQTMIQIHEKRRYFSNASHAFRDGHRQDGAAKMHNGIWQTSPDESEKSKDDPHKSLSI